MKDENTISNAEIKLGLNLAKAIYTVLTTDTPEIKEIKGSLSEIDVALKSGKSEMWLQCNMEVTKKHSSVFSNPFSKYKFRQRSREEMEQLSPVALFKTLRHMGYALEESLSLQQAMQGLWEGVKVGCEYMIDKSLERTR